MATFEASPLVDPGVPLNDLFSYNKNQAAYLANQGTQQALTDAQTARSSALGVAAGDPNAAATALAADPARGQAMVGGLAALSANQRAAQANNLQILANGSGAIAALDAAQQPAAYAQWQSMLKGMNLHIAMPDQFPGTAALLALRNSVLPAEKQIELNANYPRADGQGPMGLPVGGGVASPGGAPSAPAAATDGTPSTVTDGTPAASSGPGPSPSFSSNIIASESSGDPNATNSRSTATGAGQFLDSTWLGLLPKVRPDLASLPQAQQLALRTDPTISRQMVDGYARENAPILINAGYPADDSTLALAHHFGAEGAIKLLSNPSASAADLLGGQVMTANPDLRGKSASQILAATHARFGAGRSGNGTAPRPAPVTQTPLPPPAAAPNALLATTATTNGMPTTANDASPSPTPDNANAAPPGAPDSGLAPQPPADQQPATTPISLGSTDVRPAGAPLPGNNVFPASSNDPLGSALARLRGGQPQNALSALPGIAGSPAQPMQPNGLFSTVGAPAGGMPTNTLAPPPTSAPQPQPGTPGAPMMPQPAQSAGAPSAPPTYAPAGWKPLTVMGKPMMVEGQPGMQIYADANGQRKSFLMPGAPGVPYGRNAQVKGPNGETILFDGRNQPVTTVGANNLPIQQDTYNRDSTTLQPIQAAGQAAQTQQIRLHQMRDLLDKFQGGAGGTTRAMLQNYIETTFGPGLAAEFGKAITGVDDVGAAQVFVKMGLQGAGQDVRTVMGSNGGVEAARLFQSANPGLDLTNAANRTILNDKLISAQADADYAQGAAQHVTDQYNSLVNGKGYTPLASFNQQWQQQRNPQVYAAAMGALNGQPFQQWSRGLQPAEGQRVIAILRKVETPDTQIQWHDGARPIGGGS